MLTADNFKGVFPILATPFRDDQEPDLESLDRLVRFMANLEVDGVTVLGVLGEANRMLDREREQVIRTAVEAAQGRLPVIVGASHSGTLAARGLSQMAQELGAAAVMVTPQAEPVPNDERVFEYYRTIAEGIRIPIVLQDHPASTAVHMSVALILRIVDALANVAAIKEEAVPTAPKIRALRAGLRRSVPILTGLGALYAQFDLEAGSDGFNTGFAFPEVLQAMVAAARNGQWEQVAKLYAHVLPLIVFEQQPGVAIRKEILRLRGAIGGATVRHPGAPLAPATAEQLHRLLDHVFPGADITRRVAF